MYFSEQTSSSLESSCQTVLRLHQQALLSHSEENTKPQRENDSQLGGLREKCNGSDSAKQADWLTSLPSPPKGSHYWGHYTQQRWRDNTNSVLEPRRATAECSAHLKSCFKAADLILFWGVGAHRNLWLHGRRCTRSLIDCISLCSGAAVAHNKCLLVNECMGRRLGSSKHWKQSPPTKKQNIL